MRPATPKRAAANREYNKLVLLYLRENPECARCGRLSVVVHHICRGSHRAASLSNTETWLGLCWDCHEWIHDVHNDVLVDVLIKVRHTIRTINRLRGRAPDAITLKDVMQCDTQDAKS